MMRYTSFEDLPKGIQKRVVSIHPYDYNEWVKMPVPALVGKSVIDTMNEENGYRMLAQYLAKVEGYLG